MPVWILIIVAIVFVGSPLANAVAKAIESRASRPQLEPDEDGARRIGTLEEQVQSLSDQVYELAEKQDLPAPVAAVADCNRAQSVRWLRY